MPFICDLLRALFLASNFEEINGSWKKEKEQSKWLRGKKRWLARKVTVTQMAMTFIMATPGMVTP